MKKTTIFIFFFFGLGFLSFLINSCYKPSSCPDYSIEIDTLFSTIKLVTPIDERNDSTRISIQDYCSEYDGDTISYGTFAIEIEPFVTTSNTNDNCSILYWEGVNSIYASEPCHGSIQICSIEVICDKPYFENDSITTNISHIFKLGRSSYDNNLQVLSNVSNQEWAEWNSIYLYLMEPPLKTDPYSFEVMFHFSDHPNVTTEIKNIVIAK